MQMCAFCVSASICISLAFSLPLFLLFVLFYSNLVFFFNLFYCCSSNACLFPLKDREDVDLDGRRGREELGRVGGGEQQSEYII